MRGRGDPIDGRAGLVGRFPRDIVDGLMRLAALRSIALLPLVSSIAHSSIAENRKALSGSLRSLRRGAPTMPAAALAARRCSLSRRRSTAAGRKKTRAESEQRDRMTPPATELELSQPRPGAERSLRARSFLAVGGQSSSGRSPAPAWASRSILPPCSSAPCRLRRCPAPSEPRGGGLAALVGAVLLASLEQLDALGGITGGGLGGRWPDRRRGRRQLGLLPTPTCRRSGRMPTTLTAIAIAASHGQIRPASGAAHCGARHLSRPRDETGRPPAKRRTGPGK